MWSPTFEETDVLDDVVQRIDSINNDWDTPILFDKEELTDRELLLEIWRTTNENKKNIEILIMDVKEIKETIKGKKKKYEEKQSEEIDVNPGHRVSNFEIIRPTRETPQPMADTENTSHPEDRSQVPITATPIKKKRKTKEEKNLCEAWIKDKLGKVYFDEELAEGGFRSSVTNYKGKKIVAKELSPGRMRETLIAAERKWPNLYKTINVPAIVNEKCRKKRGYLTQKQKKLCS